MDITCATCSYHVNASGYYMHAMWISRVQHHVEYHMNASRCHMHVMWILHVCHVDIIMNVGGYHTHVMWMTHVHISHECQWVSHACHVDITCTPCTYHMNANGCHMHVTWILHDHQWDASLWHVDITCTVFVPIPAHAPITAHRRYCQFKICGTINSPLKLSHPVASDYVPSPVLNTEKLQLTLY